MRICRTRIFARYQRFRVAFEKFCESQSLGATQVSAVCCFVTGAVWNADIRIPAFRKITPVIVADHLRFREVAQCFIDRHFKEHHTRTVFFKVLYLPCKRFKTGSKGRRIWREAVIFGLE